MPWKYAFQIFDVLLIEIFIQFFHKNDLTLFLSPDSDVVENV